MTNKLAAHIEKYIARYSVLALAVLTPLAGLLGSLAADLGGDGTPAGRYVTAGASAVGVAIGGATFLSNLGKWQMGVGAGTIHPSRLDQAIQGPPTDQGDAAP